MMNKEFIVNGERVEDIEVIPTENGGYIINYKKIFNIIESDKKDAYERLNKENIKCYIIRYDRQKIIILYNFDMDNLYKIIDTLRLYQNNYEIDYEQEQIIIDIP
ncbi:hypothetical protein [uncultured Methanobrevibacter sp.]|uniref:hypothetical protein n=1 Tax=uncultured Methanobrevibacter sp. TaxID=253161 RepID=UPI0025CE1E02|nr:hypothetical protein [uncultured Methanobrevibacter sp.]